MLKKILVVFLLIFTFASYRCGNGTDPNGGHGGEEPPAEDLPAVDCDKIGRTPNHGKYFYEINPTYTDTWNDKADWRISDPESENMDSQILQTGVATLASDPYLASLVIIRNDAIVLERYFNGSARNKSNNIHSASKSILSALVGIAIDEGYITGVDQKVSDIIPKYFSVNDPKREITLHHLLTMSAGIRWNENRTERDIQNEADWVQAILDLELDYSPGEHFNYSTGLSHVMSAVITEATGTSVCQFAHQMLFDPMRITAEHWGKDPQMINSGGYNLYMTPREMAKFGMLILNKGRWKESQLVSEAFIERSLQEHVVSSAYGYFWWLERISEYPVYRAWGSGGQYIIIIEDLDLVIVSTADTSSNNTGQGINIFNFIRDYIIPSINDGA